MSSYLTGSLGILMILSAAPPESTENTDGPTVSVVLPDDVRSESLQVRYFMSGAFGG